MARKDLTADEKLRAKAAAKFGNNGTYNKGAGIKPSVRNEELTASQRLRIKAAEVERQKQYEAVTAQRKEAEERHREHIQTAGTPYSNRFGGLRDDENMWMAPVERYAADKEVGELEAELSHAEKMYDVYSDLYGSWQTSPEEKAQALEWRNRFGAQIEDITGGTLAEAKNKQHDATANYYATLTRRPDFASGSAKGAAIDNGFKTSEIEGAVTNWEFFTDAEKDIYNYLLGTGGEEAAEAYWKYMQEPAQQRLGNIYTDRVQSIDSDFGRFLAERAYGIGAGVENALGGFMQATTEKELPTSGTQFGYYQMGEGKTGLDKITYELGYQAGNMLPSMLLSGGLSAAGAPAKLAQLAGSGAMGFSAGGNAYKQGLDMGMTTEQAKAYGRLIGASEGGLQYALGGISALGGTSGKFAEAVKGIENGFLRFIAQTGGSMVSEATEEGLQAILDPIFRNAASGAEINIDWSEVAYNALMGGLMGGVFEAPGNAAEAITAGRGDAMYTPRSFKGENFAFEGLIPANVSQPSESGNSAEIRPDSPGLARAREQLRQSALAAAKKNFGREGYSAFEEEAASMDNPADLFGEMSRAYNDGLVNRHAKSFGRLTESQYERMFAAGRTDAAASVRTQMQNRGRVYSYKDAGIDMSDTVTKEYAATLSKKDAKALNNASKAFGVKIRFADSVAGGDANAEIRNGIITIEKGNPHPLRFLFGHEITHRMQELAPQEYARLRAAVAANATEFNVKTGDMMMAYAEKNRSITQDAAVDEVIANELGLILEDNAELERFIARFSNERTLLERLMDVIREIRIKLVGTEQERRLLEVEKRLDKAAKAAAKQAQSNAGATKNAAQTSDGVAKQSIKLGGYANIQVDVQTELAFFDIKSFNDYIGVQKTIYNKLLQTGFFDETTKRRVVENADTGIVVEIGKDGINETFGPGMRYARLPIELKRFKIATVRHLPDIIRYGEVVDGDSANIHNPRSSVSYTYVEHPITVDGKTLYAVVDIRQSPEKNKFWVHHIHVNTKKGQVLAANADEAASALNEDVAFDDKLTQTEEDVKVEKAVKEGKAISATDEVLFSLKDSDSLAREIKRIQTEGAKAGRSDADIQKAVTQTINSRMAQRETELKAKYAADMSAQKQKQAATAKAVGEKNKAIVKEKVKAERSKAAAAINTQREKQKAAVAKERQKRDEAIDKLKARNKERIAAEKEKKHEAIDKLKEKQKEKDAKASENRKAKELRQKIQRHASGLSQKLVHPTDKKHIPQKLQSAVAKLLHSINLESNFDYVPGSQRQTSRGATVGDRAAKGSGEPTKRTQAFAELREIYNKIKGEVVYDPDMDDILVDAIALADKPIAAMKSSELEVLWKALRAVENTVRTANKTFVQGRWQTVSEAAEAIRSENSGKKQQTEYKKNIQKLKKLTGIDMMTPEAYFHRLGKAGDTIFRMMRNAQDKHIRLMSEISDFTHEQIGKVDVRKLEKELHTVTLGGEEVQLSTAQIMELYVLMRREQAAEHISVGGIKPDSVDGKGIKMVSRATPIKGITAEELSAAFNELTDEQVELAGKLQEYSSTTLSKWGNEAAMQVYNYEKFGEKNYWPIRVNKQETQSDVNKDSAVVAIGGKGFTKATTPHANNSVRIGSIFDTFSTHASEMATYAAWLATAEDINRIRNYTFRDPDSKQRTDTVKGIIETVHGKDGTAYLQKLLEDIANGVKGKHSETEYMSGIVGNYKAASVGANIRVMIQQPTAILRAMEMIDAKYLAKGLKPNKGWEKAVKYAPIAKWKDWGYFDINTGRQMKDVLFDTDSPLDKTRQFLMAGAGKMDSLAWGQLWNAVEAETKDKQPELEAGSEEYYEAVAKRFTEIVDRTQVVDGILQRSQIMRSSNSWTKMATSFMAEPTKQYNMMVSAAYDVMTSTGEAKKNAQKHFARTTAALLISGVSNAIAQSIVDALRDDDREKKYWEKWLEAFTGFTGEEENFSDGFKAFWSGNVEAIINPAGYVPFVKDFLSLLQGYDVSRMDMESVEKVLRAVNTFRQAWSGSGKEPFINASANMFAEAARLLGIPAANIKRDVFAVINLVANETDNYLFQYRIEKFLSNMNYSSNSAKFVDILYNAYVLDPEAYEIIYADMVASGFKASTIKDGIEKRLKEAYGVDEVELLPQRYMTPEQQKSYDAVMDKVEKSDIWKNADARVRKNVSYDYYEVATGASSNSAQSMVDKMEMAAKYGIDSVEFMLYEVALGMVDKPNKNGSYGGTPTNEEVEAALNAVPGLSRTEKSDFWEEVLGKSEKNNPWG